MNMTLDDIFTSWASLISPHFPFCDQHQTVARIFFLANISFSTLCFCIIIVVVVFIIFRSVWENKMKRRKCSSMSSCLLFLIACDWPHWLRALKREGREPFVARLYVRVCSSAGSGRNARAERSELWQTSSTTDVDGTRRTCYIYLLKQQPACGGDSADLVGQFYSREGVRKFGEMHSVYLVSLLFIFSTLHVNQLTEGCSCALTHPQDAFCNSDIGG